jgi:hypothetical protein
MRVVFLFFILFLWNISSYGQFDCIPANNTFSFSPSPLAQTKFIDWAKFPTFSLPFNIVYGGPRFGDSNQSPLKHGFSHLSTYFGSDSTNLPPKNRALIWYGVAYDFRNPQPWQLIRSPWANNLDNYRIKWESEMAGYASQFNDTKVTKSPAADIFMMDIERHWEGQFQFVTDLSILAQKNNVLTPKNYSSLSDLQYVNRYKNDMLNLYSAPINYLKSAGLLTKVNKISSYADVPIRYQSSNIEGNSWADWQSKSSTLSYLMKDTVSGNLGGSLYGQLDMLAPSAYIQADYASNPKVRGGNYLSELLFQIEVNKAWSKKESMPFVWLRYEDFSLPGARFVKSYQAEAMAIFPFMAGSNSLWLWDDGDTFQANDNYATYEYFINGLYKLSLFKSFFTGNYAFYAPQNARDLNVNQLPVWRAIVKDNQILIAAQNPYAAENEVTKLPVSYKGWSNIITLTGREVFLCAFKLVDITAVETPKSDFSVKLLNNPVINQVLSFKIENLHNQLISIQLKLPNGNEFFKETFMLKAGEQNYSKYLPDWPKGEYLLSISTEKGVVTKKIVN